MTQYEIERKATQIALQRYNAEFNTHYTELYGYTLTCIHTVDELAESIYDMLVAELVEDPEVF